MGEVWKARDTRLGRSVAIKILPAEYAKNEHLRLRLEREARAISQLNHPNICTLHDVGSDDDAMYLVMEYVEGESLATRLERGAMPMSDVLRCGAQIAEALDRAHRSEIVHRDLKPANIMLTRTGVKLLDFGLAKSVRDVPQKAGPDQVTMVNQPLTSEGMVVGTLQYMSPEQIGGETVDHRSDLFALGAVLYEMATGQRAFAGSNKTSIVAAIIGEEPRPMRELQPLTPAAFEHVVEKCLAKDAEQRWQSAFDVAEELRWIAQRPSSSGDAVSAVAQPRRRMPALPWVLVAIAGAVAGWGLWRSTRVPPARVTKTIVSTELDPSFNMSPVISPDGRHVAYPAGHALWIRSLDELEPAQVPIIGTPQAILFWSPDSKWVVFASEGKLWKMSPGAKAPVVIAVIPPDVRFHSGAWGADDRIVVAEYKGGLYELSARGGSLTRLLERDALLVDFHSLLFLPDGKTLLAIPHTLTSMATVERIDGAKRHTVLQVPDATLRGIAWSPTGHLLVGLGGVNAGVWAFPFSEKSLTQAGKQFLVAANAGVCTAGLDGSLVYVSNVDAAPRKMVRVDARGAIAEAIGDVGDGLTNPLISPDERLLAYASRREDNSIGVDVLDRANGGVRHLTNSTDDIPLAWSHNNRNLLVQRRPGLNWADPRFGIWLVSADGTNAPRRVVAGWGAEFTPDDRNIVYSAANTMSDSRDLCVMPVDGGAPKTVKRLDASESFVLSPDGRFLAYSDRVQGVMSVFVMRFPAGDETWRVSPAGGNRPTWSADGHSIYFVSGSRLFAVPFNDAPAVKVGDPALVFDATPLNITFNSANYTVLRDHSVIAMQSLPAVRRQVMLVQNWLEEFR